MVSAEQYHALTSHQLDEPVNDNPDHLKSINFRLEKAHCLVNSGELTPTNQRVLTILVDNYPYLSPYDSFSSIWPKVADCRNPLQQAISRLRKHLPIHSVHSREYSLTKSSKIEGLPSWILDFSLEHERILIYCLQQSRPISYQELCVQLGDKTQEDLGVDWFEYKQLHDNKVNLAKSCINSELNRLGLGSFDRSKGFFTLTLAGESLPQAAD